MKILFYPNFLPAMNYMTLLQNLQNLAKELCLNKDKEIYRLTNNPKTQPWVIDLRKEEANKLKKLAEGLTLIESTLTTIISCLRLFLQSMMYRLLASIPWLFRRAFIMPEYCFGI